VTYFGRLIAGSPIGGGIYPGQPAAVSGHGVPAEDAHAALVGASQPGGMIAASGGSLGGVYPSGAQAHPAAGGPAGGGGGAGETFELPIMVAPPLSQVPDNTAASQAGAIAQAEQEAQERRAEQLQAEQEAAREAAERAAEQAQAEAEQRQAQAEAEQRARNTPPAPVPGTGSTPNPASPPTYGSTGGTPAPAPPPHGGGTLKEKAPFKAWT
jgi:hypothetical protein